MMHSSTHCRTGLWMLLLATLTLAAPPQLTYENYDSITEGRSILIRFVTNWCEECDATQEAWGQLSKEWEGHPIGFVAEVFCDSEEGEMICDGYEVAGYPSVYYGDPESPEIYSGALDYESLSSFAKDNISAVQCSVKNLDACSPKVKKLVAKLRTKTQEELETLEKGVLKQVEEEQSRFDKTAMKIQQQYRDLSNNFNNKIDKLRDESGFKWVQQLLNEIEQANEQGGEEGSQDEL